MDSIEDHIQKDKQILDDPTTSPQNRRHIEDELDQLESYHEKHPEDHHDPSSLELYCDKNPDALECRIYED
ncbi:MAG: CP12 domain-containing protein [Candidatus Nanopelagicaceae bacterium]